MVDPIPFTHPPQLNGAPSQSVGSNLPPSATASSTVIMVDAVGTKPVETVKRKTTTNRRTIKSLSPSPSDDGSRSALNGPSPAKKRKLNMDFVSTKKEEESGERTKRRRGRPRKESVIKKEEGMGEGAKGKKLKRRGRRKKKNDSDDDLDMEQFLTQQLSGESFVGIRTEDGEVRIQIPPSSSRSGPDQEFSKVQFSVFGNACSDKIEDILQPKKRTRYVRGLSEDEKKQRRYALWHCAVCIHCATRGGFVDDGCRIIADCVNA